MSCYLFFMSGIRIVLLVLIKNSFVRKCNAFILYIYIGIINILFLI